MGDLEQPTQQHVVDSMQELPSLSHVQNSIGKMRNNKAAGTDGIPVDVLKKGGRCVAEKKITA